MACLLIFQLLKGVLDFKCKNKTLTVGNIGYSYFKIGAAFAYNVKTLTLSYFRKVI